MAKRERERVRQQRQQAKRLKRETASPQPEGIGSSEEARLMDEFRLLSERHAAGAVSETTYAIERHRILAQLGIDDVAG